jgi:ATP-dependent helicase/nuclease subunit A
VCRRAAAELLEVLRHVQGGLPSFLADGPSGHPRYQLFLRQVERLAHADALTNAQIRSMLDRIAQHFLTQQGQPRKGNSIAPYNVSHYPDAGALKRHRDAVINIAPQVHRVIRQFSRELNVVLARGIRKMFAIAMEQYRRTLEARSALDFSDVLDRALSLLRRMDEFSRSRYRLESRYHHVLVDEFQDTSRAQWELISLLVKSWGEGLGLASNPSIFIVGDRKQSIYRFRDAEVAVLQEAAQYIEGLRPGSGSRRAISRSFRAVPELLEFVNDICAEIAQPASGSHAFTYGETDRFPPVPAPKDLRGPALGISVGESPEVCAAAVAAEIERLLREDVVRDKKTGVARGVRPGDIAILFRSRTSHREFEHELEKRGIPTYVYKGLGFFDADEIKDACALLRYLADPASDLRAAALLRSRIARVSDRTLAALAPHIADAILRGPKHPDRLDPEDVRTLAHLREQMPRWLALVDRVPPADLFEQMLPELAYAYEIRGPRRQQAWENLKKMRGLIRRIQNRGYATLSRIADHIDALSAGDESNAVLEAIDAVNLMTVHASKGLEFPVVFVVNMAKGATGLPRPVKVIVDAGETPSVSVGPFVSDVDALEREREQHETRRLLYVALTRARDRLYLSSALKEGQLKPGPGSLAEVLPHSIRPVFAAAAATADERIPWTSTAGRTFEFRVCRPPQEAGSASVQEAAAAPAASLETMPPPVWTQTGAPRLAATTWVAGQGSAREKTGGGSDAALAGRLVHRLFEHASRGALRETSVREVALSLITPEERAMAVNVSGTIDRAVDLWSRLRERAELVAVLKSPEVYAEVPFSLRTADRGHEAFIRGTIDLLAIGHDGVVRVVELKTGAPLAEHQRQLDLYVHAARSMFPMRQVEGLLVHA